MISGTRLGGLLLLYAVSVAGHAHHHDEDIDKTVPFDTKIWIHMSLMTALWSISFPIGMVLGLSKSKYHVPLQIINTAVFYFARHFGHHHSGRQFPATVHGIMGSIVTWIVFIQVVIGTFLKLHIMEKTIRRYIVPIHSTLGKLFPLVGWTQMLMGVATALSFCRGGELGQCLAHYIMGSAFIAYAAILVIMLNFGGHWLERRGCSQELLDSCVIMIWGIINTFTMHQGGPWTNKDMQHTMLGVLWWAGGLLGIFLSRGGKRSFVPAVIIIMTGWGMSAHEQHLMISSKIHGLFGYALIAAGVMRLIEICFVLSDGATPHGIVRIFQHLPPYLLVLGGTLFISATDEEMHNAHDLGIDHVSYALFDFSISFLIYLVITFLVHLYQSTGIIGASGRIPNKEEEGYTKLETGMGHDRDSGGNSSAEMFELTEQDLDSGDEDAVKIQSRAVGNDWMNPGGLQGPVGART